MNPQLLPNDVRASFLGRPPGSSGSRWLDIKRQLTKWGCNPLHIAAKIAMNDVECGVCRGRMTTFYKLPTGSHREDCNGVFSRQTGLCKCQGVGERVCESCFGTGFEKIDPWLRGKMATELMKYCYPQLKAVQHQNVAPNGGRAPINITFVNAAPQAEPQQPAIETTATSEDTADDLESVDL